MVLSELWCRKFGFAGNTAEKYPNDVIVIKRNEPVKDYSYSANAAYE